MFSLKELIERLSKEDPNQIVPLGLGSPHSYRGFYDELAFSPKENVTVGEMLNSCQQALEATFTGWKGGEYTMHEFTQCWLAEWGEANGQTIGPILLDYMLGKYAARQPR